MDWVDFMSWAYVTVSSLSRERMVLNRGQDEMASNITSKKRHAVKMKELSDVSKKLLNLVRLKLDETSKSLALTLPWEVALSLVKAVGNSDTSSGALDFNGLGNLLFWASDTSFHHTLSIYPVNILYQSHPINPLYY